MIGTRTGRAWVIAFMLLLSMLVAACGGEGATEADGDGADTADAGAGEDAGATPTEDGGATADEAEGEAGEDVAVEGALPDVLSLVAYDVGSSNYNQAQALGEGLRGEYGIRLRVVPSGTGTGRMVLLTNGDVDAAFLATEGDFAAEGLYDFATREWGPQDIRAVWSIPEQFGLPVAATSDIETVSDLAGRRVAIVPGNPSLNVKQEAILAYGGLSYDDVEVVEVGSYGDALRQVLEGRIDTVAALPTSSAMVELEATEGMRWLSVDPDDEEGWDRLLEVYPPAFPANPSIPGAGYTMDDVEDLWFLGYRSPYVTVQGEASDEEAYALTKAIHESYDRYEDLFNKMPDWNIERAGRPGGPTEGVPFHPGAVAYLRDAGVWTDEYDEWNQTRIDHLTEVQLAWDEAVDAAVDEGVGDADFPSFWMEQREERGWTVGLNE